MTADNKKIFCTFADSRLKNSVRRIRNQAQEMEIYDEIITYDENNLDADFSVKFGKHLKKNVRGYGYWVWKPQIILQTLRHMKEGDILNYCDAGCWLNKNGRNRLIEYFSMAEESHILAFQAKNTFNDHHLDSYTLPSRNWTKGDLLDYFGARNRPEIVDTEQIGAGVIFIKKCKKSEKLIRQWLKVYEDDFSLADDTPSKSQNLIGFVEHRHDQSIFTIICKLNGVSTVSAFEYYYPSAANPSIPDWDKIKCFPIWAKRDKDFGFIMSRLKKIYRSIFR